MNNNGNSNDPDQNDHDSAQPPDISPAGVHKALGKAGSNESAVDNGTQDRTAQLAHLISLREFGLELCNDVATAQTAALLGEIASYYVTRRAIEVLLANRHGADPDAIAKAIFHSVSKQLQVDAQKYIVTHFCGRN